MQNKGYRQRERNPNDWILGGFTPLESKILRPNGQYDDCLPVSEKQHRYGLETMACVTFSALNCLETLQKAKYGIAQNFSDRFTAKMSNTSKQGNWQWYVAKSIANDGVVDEYLWSWIPEVDTWDEYYSPIPQEIQNDGLEWCLKNDFYYEWVNQVSLKTALMYGPVQVIVKYATGDGLLNPFGEYNHAVMCYGYTNEGWKIFDHYDQELKLYHIDYKFGGLMRFDFNKKNMSIFEPLDNELYLLVEGTEQKLAMGLGGKLVIYDQKVDTLLNSASRAKQYKIPKPLTLADWNNAPHVNGKGEII